MVRRDNTRRLACLGALVLILIWPALATAVSRAEVYARDGRFRLFRGPEQLDVSDVQSLRMVLLDAPPRYETEARLPDGSWHRVNRDNGDRLLEIQTFSTPLTYRLEQTAPLYSQPAAAAAYRLPETAGPGDYTVRQKAYNFIELTGPDGRAGWIVLPENKQADVVAQPGHVVGARTALDHRRSPDLTVKTEIAPLVSRVQTEMVPQFVTVHNASNFEPYATAEWHAYQMSLLTFMPGVNYHYVVDDKEAYQLLPLNEVSFNAGDRFLNGNGASVAIEICDYADGQHYPAAEANGAKLAAAVLYQLGLPKENLRFHRDWNGKECPLSMIEGARGSIGLDAFRESVYAEYETLALTYGRTYTGTAPDSGGHSPDATVVRSRVVRGTDLSGAEVTRVVTEVIHVTDAADYGVLPLAAALVFALTVVAGLIYAVAGKQRR